MQPRRQKLYRVALVWRGSGACIRSVVCNSYLLPGVLWAYKEQSHNNWYVREEYIGMGRLDSTYRDRPIDLIPPNLSIVRLHYTDGTTKMEKVTP